MEKLAKEQIKPFNDTFLSQIESGNIKEAAASAMQYTRVVLREDSFTEKVLTPIDIANDELDKSENPELHVKWCDREPDQPAAPTSPEHRFDGRGGVVGQGQRRRVGDRSG